MHPKVACLEEMFSNRPSRCDGHIRVARRFLQTFHDGDVAVEEIAREGVPRESHAPGVFEGRTDVGIHMLEFVESLDRSLTPRERTSIITSAWCGPARPVTIAA